MVHKYIALILLTSHENRCMKNLFFNLVTFSIPKVAKKGQKVPILAKFEIRPGTECFYAFLQPKCISDEF